jgi:holo-[acyl-carrier protein] synthase
VAGLRIGLDLVSVDAVRESIATHGERYLSRTYTDDELRECDGRPERLAARFAAKEAVMKALDRGDEPLPWTSIAVHRDESGRPSLVLTGAAAELASRRGLGTFELSLTHEAGFGAAVVVALPGY